MSMAILEKMTPLPPGSALERFQKEDSHRSAKHRSRMQQEQGKGRESEVDVQYIRIQIAEQSGIHHRPETNMVAGGKPGRTVGSSRVR